MICVPHLLSPLSLGPEISTLNVTEVCHNVLLSLDDISKWFRLESKKKNPIRVLTHTRVAERLILVPAMLQHFFVKSPYPQQ